MKKKTLNKEKEREKMRKKKIFVSLFLALMLCLSGCGSKTPGFHGNDVPIDHDYETDPMPSQGVVSEVPSTPSNVETPSNTPIVMPSYEPSDSNDVPSNTNTPSNGGTPAGDASNSVERDLGIPAYSGSPYAVVNNNESFFTKSDITSNVFETYSEHDSLGRCGVAFANICKELMPTEKRESISSVKPSGWINKPYDFVDGGYIYNRCHLIGFQLAGENANDKNLITGTRYMNVDGMLPFENMIDDYVEETNNHVLYRVTPLYEGNNLVASGVLMEAFSIEDGGDGITFNVYCYNVQPGCEIDYATGDNWLSSTPAPNNNNQSGQNNQGNNNTSNSQEKTYIVNTNSKKFHKPECSNAQSISEGNRMEITTSYNNMISQGYSPCGSCKPQ